MIDCNLTELMRYSEQVGFPRFRPVLHINGQQLFDDFSLIYV
jgi:hypothetical protein